ncbi:hypothetical protein JCM16303_006035 [Sporobolomyces ruberrimus]
MAPNPTKSTGLLESKPEVEVVIGQDAHKVMAGETERGKGGIKEETWDRLNDFIVSTISISCHASVIHHVSDCEYNARAYWSALRNAFRPTDAQGSLRLLTRLWSLSLSSASPESFDTFAKEYKATIGALKAAKIDLENVYASHLLNALPSSLNSLQTTLAVSNQESLPSIETILKLVRNEVLRTSTSSSSIALVASSSSSSADKFSRPPPSPCPACGADHWLAKCAQRDAYRASKAKAKKSKSPPPGASGNFASVLESIDGVELWLSAPSSLVSSSSSSLTLDSGATHSMCGDAKLFSNFLACEPSAVGGILSGTDYNLIVKINKALLVPGISRNLLSSSQLFDLHGIVSTFGEAATLSRQDRVVATGSRLSNGLCQLDGTLIDPLQGASLMSLSKSDQVVGLEVEKGGSEDRSRVCNVCHIAHSSCLPFPRSDRLLSAPLQLIHSDVLSINVPSLGGRRYVVTFVDDFSRMLWVEPLAQESDVLEAFKKLKALVENESGKKITRFDQTMEKTKRVNRTIVEGLISLLSQAGAPEDLWAEALQAFVFVKNRSPHAALDGKVPLSVWRNRPVSVSMLRVWGCRAWHTVTNGRSKLDDKAIPLVFVGYNGDTTAY